MWRLYIVNVDIVRGYSNYTSGIGPSLSLSVTEAIFRARTCMYNGITIRSGDNDYWMNETIGGN